VPGLTAVAFTVALGYGIVAPAIPEFAREFGVSAAAAASVISIFALVRIAAALPAGRLVSRLGARPVMTAGILVVAASSVLAGFSRSFAALLIARGAGGLGSAMYSVGAQTLLLVSVPSGQRGRATGLFSGGFLVGAIAGPAVGGLIAEWSLRAPFIIYGVLLIVPAVITAVVLTGPPTPAAAGDQPLAEPPAGAAGERPAPSGARAAGPAGPAPASRGAAGGQPAGGQPAGGPGRAVRSRAFAAAATAAFADGFASMGVRSAIVPLFVVAVLHRSAAWTGAGFVVFAVLNAAVLLPGGWAADAVGRRPVIITGAAAGAAGMAMLALLPSVPGYLAGLAVAGLGSGLLDVAPAAMVGDLLAGRGGTLVALYQMAGDAGAVTGPVAAGLLVDRASYAAAFGLAAGVLGLAAVLAAVAREARPPGAPGRALSPAAP
jgi:DHA1 family multidrug resistance protein-like MFS transporter